MSLSSRIIFRQFSMSEIEQHLERTLKNGFNSDFALCVLNDKRLWMQFYAEWKAFFHRFPGRNDVLRFQGAHRMQNHLLPCHLT